MGEEPQTAPLLSENDGVTAATREPESQNDILVNYRYRYYTLTSCRYTNVIRLMLFADAVIAIALWASGGNAEYFVDNIIWFHMKQSTFDLALITVFKCLLLFILYSKLEDITLEQLRTPYDNNVFKKKRILHLLIILFSLIFFAYPVIKGGLILNSILNDPNYTKMVLTYNVLAICAIVFSFLELSMALISFWAMKKLKLQRIMHRLNDAHEEVAEDGKPIRRNVNIFRLVKLIKPELGILSLSILCLLGATASQTTAPLFFGMVVDAAQKSMEKLNHTVLILLLIYVGGAIAGMLRATLFTLAGQRMVARLRKHLFSSIIQQDIAFFDTNRTGELTNRLASDTQVLQNAVTVNISMLARYLLQIIGSLVFMFVLNASLTGVLLAVVPIISLGAVQYGKFVRKIRQRFQDRLADASATAEESISNIRTVRSFVGETKAVASYSESVDQSYREGKKLALAEGSFTGIIGIVVAAAISLVLWYGGKLVFEKHITAGVLTSFLLYTLNVAFAFGLLSSVYGDFMQAVGASVRIFELLDKKPAVSNQGGLKLDNLQGGLEFDEVQFTYPSRPENKVLKGVSFHVKSGQMVALVGPSGGGKSTIVNLIERFYDPDSGHVKLGSTFLNQLDPSWFRKQMSIVSQEPTLFACSIRDNISYGKDADLDEIQEAAKQANAHDFIMTFEDKYDTLVGERGVRLSGGQKQRIAIARALLMNPDILLLDEATSALDAESEHLVQEAIDRAMSNRTVLVIAHRLSTVRNASKVIVISKGQIAEEGTHDELIARNGVYKRLVLRQLTAGDTNMKDENLEQSVE